MFSGSSLVTVTSQALICSVLDSYSPPFGEMQKATAERWFSLLPHKKPNRKGATVSRWSKSVIKSHVRLPPPPSSVLASSLNGLLNLRNPVEAACSSAAAGVSGPSVTETNGAVLVYSSCASIWLSACA